jgi:hypothetical protein
MTSAPRHMRAADIGLPPNPDIERGRWEGAHDVLEQIGEAIAKRRNRHGKSSKTTLRSDDRKASLERYAECDCILKIVRAIRMEALS